MNFKALENSEVGGRWSQGCVAEVEEEVEEEEVEEVEVGGRFDDASEKRERGVRWCNTTVSVGAKIIPSFSAILKYRIFSLPSNIFRFIQVIITDICRYFYTFVDIYRYL